MGASTDSREGLHWASGLVENYNLEMSISWEIHFFVAKIQLKIHFAASHAMSPLLVPKLNLPPIICLHAIWMVWHILYWMVYTSCLVKKLLNENDYFLRYIKICTPNLINCLPSLTVVRVKRSLLTFNNKKL